ncbi:MAG: SH3 domain-containing protein [Nitrospinales bacterium]
MFIHEKKFTLGLISVLLMLLVGCASKPSHFESPSESISANDRSLFSKALNEQGKGRYEAARTLWSAYIAEHPNSHEAHNNLGMAYFLDDRVGESIPEFEAAHKWAPFSERIRDNLSRAYQLQVSVMEENREYDGAIGHLKSLSAISTAMEKEKVLFKIEELDHELFESLKKLNSSEGFENYIKKYPGGPNAREAKKRLEELQKSSSLPTESSGEAIAAVVEEESSSVVPDSHGENSMGKVAELEDITDEVMSSGKPAMEEKSLPPMASGMEALPITEDEPLEAMKSEVSEEMMETSEVMDSAMDGATTEAETLVSKAETPTDNLISELSAVAEDSNAEVEAEAKEVMESSPTASAEEVLSSGGEGLSSQTISEMEALADESSSEVSGMAENIMAEPEVSTPVAETMASSASAVDTLDSQEALETAMSEPSELEQASSAGDMVANADPRAMGDVNSLPLAPIPTGEVETPEMEIPAEMSEPVTTVTEEETQAMMAEVEAEIPMAEVEEGSAPVKIIVKVNSLLKVRSTPSLGGKVVGSLKNNDVRIMVKEVEGWYKVEHMDGLTGWISQKYSHKMNGG